MNSHLLDERREDLWHEARREPQGVPEADGAAENSPQDVPGIKVGRAEYEGGGEGRGYLVLASDNNKKSGTVESR